VVDIKEMGSKSCVGQIPGRSGDFHPYNRSASKARTRRYWKRAARREGVARINEEE
jgi:hypothetical protein